MREEEKREDDMNALSKEAEVRSDEIILTFLRLALSKEEEMRLTSLSVTSSIVFDEKSRYERSSPSMKSPVSSSLSRMSCLKDINDLGE